MTTTLPPATARPDDADLQGLGYQPILRRKLGRYASFAATQAAAFGAERAAWVAAGEFDRDDDPGAGVSGPARPGASGGEVEVTVPAGGTLIQAPFVAAVWRIEVAPGQPVLAGQPLLMMEAMKMETVVRAPCDGIVDQVLVGTGAQVLAGEALLVLAGAADLAEVAA